VRWVVGQRLAGLGGAVEYVLGAAAVLGDEFDLVLLGQVVDLGPDSLLSTLDRAVAARLVEERPGAPGRYAFHHPLVRDVLYHGLPAGERARARRRIAAGRAAGGPDA
jgi:predicted ATPase